MADEDATGTEVLDPTEPLNPPQARELSAEEQQERAELCYGIEKRIKESIAHGREALWQLAEALYEFDEAQGWTALGYETQQEFLAQPEIGMTRTDYFRMVRKYRELVVNRKVPVATLAALEPSKIDIVMPAVASNRVKIKKALDDVESLSASDLRERYMGSKEGGKGAVTGKGSKNGKHENGDGPSAEEIKQAEAVLSAAAAVDSWIEIGGDRRKAQRSWKKFLETHPVFQAISTISASFDGEEGAPDRDGLAEPWKTVCEALGLSFES